MPWLLGSGVLDLTRVYPDSRLLSACYGPVVVRLLACYQPDIDAEAAASNPKKSRFSGLMGECGIARVQVNIHQTEITASGHSVLPQLGAENSDFTERQGPA